MPTSPISAQPWALSPGLSCIIGTVSSFVSGPASWMDPSYVCCRFIQSCVWSCIPDRLWTHVTALSSALSLTPFPFAPDWTPSWTLNLIHCSAITGAARGPVNIWICNCAQTLWDTSPSVRPLPSLGSPSSPGSPFLFEQLALAAP